MKILEAMTHARKLGISPSAYHVLLCCIDDSPLLPTVIAERTGISTAAVTGSVDRLEAGGWLQRMTTGKDRRKRPVMPTEKAFQLFILTLEATP